MSGRESAPVPHRDDSAGRQAREVVGLYGDPDTTWGICLELGFASPLVPALVQERLHKLVAAHPHLGPEPVLVEVGDLAWDRNREGLAAAPYSPGEALVRIALGDEGRRLLVAAHHGVCDGLGLVAIADSISGAGLLSRARGIGSAVAPRSFLGSSLGRLREALVAPPPRFASLRHESTPGENLRVRTLERIDGGTVALCVALADVFVRWNGAGAGSPLFVTGASRREPGTLAPDRQTAYLRFRYEPTWDAVQARAAFRQLTPEPEFPETSAGGIGPRVTRLLRNRLGATAQLSNLGVVEGAGLVHAAMFPAVSGPRSVAVGLVSTATTSTLSLRTRGSEFGPSDTDELLDLIAERFGS